jgi:uncharacterized membrane protein
VQQGKTIGGEKLSLRNSVRKGWYSIPALCRLLIVICLVAGVTLRFVNLEGKVYQHDETFTSLRISGYTEAAAVQALSSAGVVSLSDIKKYQHHNPETGVVETVRGLASEEPQLTPLYFILARFWTGWFGDSIAAVRTLSVAGSLLALPCMYWLCWELFESASAGWIGMTLLAVSPFQLVYAQEARPYSLWATTILLSTAALLTAMRVQTRASWLIYAVTSALNFYAYLFSGFVAIAHVIYVLAVERFHPNRRLLAFAIAFGLSLLAFSPWLLVILTATQQINHATRWTWTVNHILSLSDLYRQSLFYLSTGFIDIFNYQSPIPIKYFLSMSYWIVRVLVIYGVYLLYRKSQPQIWGIVFLLILAPALGLILPDLMFGGTRFLVSRYVVPVYLGCQIIVTYVISRKLLVSTFKSQGRRLFWQGMTAIVLFVGLFSCGLIVQSGSWWNKMISNNNPHIAQLINQADRPLLISDTGLGDLLSLTHYLDPKVHLLVRPYCYTACQLSPAYRDLELFPYLPPIPSGYSDVFLFYARPQPLWKKRLAKATYYPLDVLTKTDEEWLWKVKL